MVKMILDIEGMSCGMCEAHINDAVRRAFPASKVVSSRKKKTTEIICDSPLEEQTLTDTIEATGYRLTGIRVESYKKKDFSLFCK